MGENLAQVTLSHIQGERLIKTRDLTVYLITEFQWNFLLEVKLYNIYGRLCVIGDTNDE